MTKIDKALREATDIINGLGVCECGHTRDEHLMLDRTTKCGEKRCSCREFRPVTFRLVRA